jgi:hypothetical protein
MPDIENILFFHGLDNYIQTCINGEIDLDVLQIFGELYLDIEIGMDTTELDDAPPAPAPKADAAAACASLYVNVGAGVSARGTGLARGASPRAAMVASSKP